MTHACTRLSNLTLTSSIIMFYVAISLIFFLFADDKCIIDVKQ